MASEDLEAQARAMAEKTLPSSLPAAARAAKLPTLTQKILERLKKQRDEQSMQSKEKATTVAAGPIAAAQPAAPVPPPPPPSKPEILRIEGVELFGDEPWFDDGDTRRRLRESVVEAHREEKILVGPAADEVERICPSNGRVLGAGAVLRLGGAHQGGYGEQDVQYAYRQLARALHPDKNPNIPTAANAFKRLSEAADELRQGLTEQRDVLKTLVAFAGRQATTEMLERPQEAIFAEACRVLHTVSTTAGEGHIDRPALNRAAAVNSQKALLLASEWFQKSQLLEIFGTTSVRTAYDCAPKRYRAQFLCLINRLLIVEARQFGDGHIRTGWNSIMQNFPELGLWREFRDSLSVHVWDISKDPAEAEERVYADEDEEKDAKEPKEPELDSRTKAQRLLEFYWQTCSGPTFQTAHDKLRHRGKMTLHLGIMQLMEEATQEVVAKLNLKEGKEWKFKQTVELVKEHADDDGIRQKALELERMVEYPAGKLFGIRDERRAGAGRSERPSRSRSRRRRSRSVSHASRRRRRRRSSSRRSSRSRRSRRRDRRDRRGEGRDERPRDTKPEKDVKGEATGDADSSRPSDVKRGVVRTCSKWDVAEGGSIRVPGRTADGRPTYRRQWDAKDGDAARACAAWVRPWRLAIAALLPSGFDAALPLTHPDIRRLTAVLWKHILKWEGSDSRCLGLFKADAQTPQTFGWAGRSKSTRGLDPDLAPCEWAFVPMSDLLLVVGEGIVGITSEGIFSAHFPGHQRFTLDEYLQQEEVPDLSPTVAT
ncbi:unnamed protein product [Symbiodinium microadriaticum]|nr:unnamed protein product [Symbiodinium microadriaticum]